MDSFRKARGWSRSELARQVGVSRQAASLWFRSCEANLHSLHLIRLSQALGVPMEELTRPLPCFDPDTYARLHAVLLWDHLFPELDDLALALRTGDPRALGRYVEVYGLYAAELTLGTRVWSGFPGYARYIHPARRRDLEVLWAWHEARTTA